MPAWHPAWDPRPEREGWVGPGEGAPPPREGVARAMSFKFLANANKQEKADDADMPGYLKMLRRPSQGDSKTDLTPFFKEDVRKATGERRSVGKVRTEDELPVEKKVWRSASGRLVMTEAPAGAA